MKLALQQAQKNLANTKENPSVGCVITKNNSVISVGATSDNGRPHAEYNAIYQSTINLKGTELYATLEPCSHYGKTPPCIKSIINSGVKKVFFSINDPDLRSYNKSAALLKKKNVKVKKGICRNETSSFYRSYIKSKGSLLPFVTCKLAVSKDFFTINKKERWITNKFSRARVHLMRSNHDCIMTSSKTIINDNPVLTCRINGLENRSPSRIILDRNLKISLNSNIIKGAKSHRTIIFYNKVNKNKIKKLKNLGIQVIKISLDKESNLDLHESLIKTKELGFYRVFLESGKKMTTNFLYKNLIDDFILFISNKNLLKNGKNIIKNELKLFLSNKKANNEKVNLFGEKLIRYKIK
jgi:diaminohydroxyphosphoribosylaminopyrimidine deaminase/5-amino-6-(5-phosphoribosylamino)uracil reductase